jgi:hypothetical protein
MSRNLSLVDQQVSSKTLLNFEFTKKIVKTGMENRSDRYVFPESYSSNPEFIYPRPWSPFVPEDLCMYCISLFSGKAVIMSSRSRPTQFYERRKKSRHDVNAGEGGLRNPPPQRTSERTVLRDFPRGRMHIDTEIEEVEEDPMEISDDESADDETYKMSPVPPSKNSSEDDVESIESELRRQVEEEEQEEMVEGTINPKSRGRVPFNPSSTIRRPHKPLSYHVTSYRGKGTTKQVKRLQKINPRSQQRNAFDYRFHT